MKAGWELKALGDFSEVKYGYTAKAQSDPVGPSFLRITDIQKGAVDWSKVPYCKVSLNDQEKHRLLSGDLVFARTGATTGKSFLIHQPPEAVCASYLIRLRPDPVVALPKHLNYYFQTSEYWEEVESGTEGAAQGGFNATKLSALKIPLPPLAEQKRIVSILDEAFEGLDRARENAEANLKNARELLDATFNTLLTSTKDEVAAEWSISPLGELCENLDSKRVPITKNQRVEGPIPYYGASGIVDYVQGHLFNEPLLLISEDGANLLARTYPIAFSIKGKTWVNNHAHVLRFDTAETRRFVELYLNSIPLDPYISGMAQPKLNQKKLTEIPIPIPNLQEQSRIIGLMDKCSNGYFQLESSYSTKLQDISDLRQSLLQKAFAGELA